MKELFTTTLTVVAVVGLMWLGATYGTTNLWLTGATILVARFGVECMSHISKIEWRHKNVKAEDTTTSAAETTDEKK